MMKRYNWLILCLACVMWFAACALPEESDSFAETSSLHEVSLPEKAESKAENEEMVDISTFLPTKATPDYDMQNGYVRFRAACESETVYYFLPMSSDFLHYYDKTTGESGVLCGKPECAHDSKECNAYIIGDSSMCYYNNKVYWHDSQNGVNYLYSMAPDATERQQEKVLKSEIAGNNLMVRLHRDYVYIAKIDSVVEDGASSKTIRITREPLGSITEEPELVYEESCTSGGDFFIQAAGNVLYILVNTYDVETRESKVALHGYNIENQQLVILTEKACQGLIVKDFRYVTGDTCYISLYDGWGSTDTVELWQWNQAINQLDVLFTEEPVISKPYLQEKHVVLLTGADNPRYCVMDYSGNIIREGKMPFPQGVERVRFTHMGGTEEYTLVFLADWDGEAGSLLMIPFDPAEEIQVLWTNV